MTIRQAAIAAFLSILVFAGCSRKYTKPEITYENETQRDDYTIYSISIEHVYLNNLLANNKREVKSVVIIAQTNDLDEYWRDKFTGELEDEGIPDEVIEAWNSENEAPSPMIRKFDLDYEYHLVTRDELSKYGSDSFFNEFYRKYPDSNGLISVSRIGYDGTRTMALIHVIHSFGTLGSRYYFLVLKKSDDGWKISRRISSHPYKK